MLHLCESEAYRKEIFVSLIQKQVLYRKGKNKKRIGQAHAAAMQQKIRKASECSKQPMQYHKTEGKIEK